MTINLWNILKHIISSTSLKSALNLKPPISYPVLTRIFDVSRLFLPIFLCDSRSICSFFQSLTFPALPRVNVMALLFIFLTIWSHFPNSSDNPSGFARLCFNTRLVKLSRSLEISLKLFRIDFWDIFNIELFFLDITRLIPFLS